jgi:hypothetical protein
MGEFFYLYLKKGFGNQEKICEWGYNIVEACKKFRQESMECNLFLELLDGKFEFK